MIPCYEFSRVDQAVVRVMISAMVLLGWFSEDHVTSLDDNGRRGTSPVGHGGHDGDLYETHDHS